DRAAEHVGRAVGVEIDEPLDRAHGRRRGREDAALGVGRRLQRGHGREADSAGGSGLEELATTRPGRGRLALGAPWDVVAAAAVEAPSRDAKRFHGRLLSRTAGVRCRGGGASAETFSTRTPEVPMSAPSPAPPGFTVSGGHDRQSRVATSANLRLSAAGGIISAGPEGPER